MNRVFAKRLSNRLIVASSLAGLAFIITCRPRPDSSSKNALSSLQPSVRVFHQGKDQYRIRFPGTKVNANDGQPVTVRLGMVQKLDGEGFSCEELASSPQSGKLLKSREYFDIDVAFGDKALERCNASTDGRKVSLACQNSGDWNGPKTLAACVYEQNNNLIVSGRAAPEGALKDGNAGLALAESIPHENTVLSYGKVCAQRLGSLPRDWSCLDGAIIPITREGVEVPFGQHQPRDRCDNPAYLGLGDQGQCVPYARLGRLKTKPDVETVFICRRYKIGDNIVQRDSGGARKVEQHISPDVPLFQDVAIVQHNVKTGETCFFQALSGFQAQERDLPGIRIPPPDEEEIPADIVQKYAALPPKQRPAKASSFWLKPSDPGEFAIRMQDPFEPQNWVYPGFPCIKCHDSDPFIQTPYVSQVNYVFPKDHPLAGRKDKMVPCDPGSKESLTHPECVFLKNDVNYSKGKYSLLHKKRQGWWPQSYAIAPKGDDTCVRCHRIGSMETCSKFAKDSVGGLNIYPNWVTDYGKLFPESHWMPISNDFFADNKTCKPNKADPNNPVGCGTNLAAWKQTFGRGAEKTLECCKLALANHSDKPAEDSAEFKEKCTRTPISTLPPAISGKNDVRVATAQETTLADFGDGQPGRTTVPLTPPVSATGKLAYLNFSAEFYHDSHGDLRIELVHGEQRVQIYSGQETASPNAYGPLYVNINSADSEAMAQFLNAAATGDWSVEIFDDGALEVGSLKTASLDLSFQ